MKQLRPFFAGGFSFILFLSLAMNGYAAEDAIIRHYADVEESWSKSQVKDADGIRLEIAAADFTAKSGDADISVGAVGGKQGAVIWNNDSGQLNYIARVPAGGLYEIAVEYYSIDPVQQPVERGLLVNGSLPFAESGNFLFERRYEKDRYPFPLDDGGNNIHPKFNEVKQWTLMPLSDRNGGNAEPLKFYLKQGDNRLTLTGLNGKLAIGKLVVQSPEKLEDYDAYQHRLPAASGDDAFVSKLEAENTAAQSGTNIQLLNIAQPGLTPQQNGKRLFNAVGGENWSSAHDWIEWKFDVPQDGIYNIALKYAQNINADISSYRTIAIDGRTPFQELLDVSFPYGASWRSKVLGGDKPYDFYLTQGTHTLRLTVTNAPYRNVQQELQDTVRGLRELDLKVQSIVGVNNVDVYRIWNLKQYIPGIDADLKLYSDTLRKQAEAVSRLTGVKTSAYGELLTAARDLDKLSQRVDDIPKRDDALSAIYTSVTDWANKLSKQPLTLDSVTIKSKNAAFPSIKVGFFHKLIYYVKQFFASFAGGGTAVKSNDADTIQVWVQRNKNYVNLMQDYANEYFTPMTGIKINVNYCPPGGNLLVLANAAGKQPDVATGVDAYTAYAFAERDALVRLDQLQGFGDLKAGVVPGAMLPYSFKGGYYGLPEEVIYNVLYYREDVLKRLNISVPQDWDDVVKDIATLEQQNYNFFYPYGDFQTFFAQHDVPTYSEDGKKVAFTTPEGFKAFQFWTDLYIKYGMPQQMANFYQHFRLGDAPVGIAGIDQYILFKLSAPDISGLWNITLAPGTKDSSGNIQRWEAGTQNGVMLFKSNQERQDKAWQFTQWWLSTKTQTNFANDLSNYFGPEFMWYSPNPNVIAQQNFWSKDVKRTLSEQLNWYKPIPYVLGGSYMTPRSLWNAWTSTVIDKKNYRQQMELAARDIQAEMDVKQQEFGDKR
ncbi:ABC-type glycerol-3-phosphate transport system substrate-binding protein [Paenibacillus taihuensis]|uniref:ABC-type glycerol-3-phosphate transport system substrate-binding protein n=1 Tax=Paenibacillus taihuensis TaxID=1156355 RepID=A0A3D9R2M2_9BACL|nr:extracellular solute-binding protein [Paenibacillus taihuensis]REE69555.1 ABC-type glycerol-3-phosphate transport system substrate-binding protein [Paenibacillus taihuensis]